MLERTQKLCKNENALLQRRSKGIHPFKSASRAQGEVYGNGCLISGKPMAFSSLEIYLILFSADRGSKEAQAAISVKHVEASRAFAGPADDECGREADRAAEPELEKSIE